MDADKYFIKANKPIEKSQPHYYDFRDPNGQTFYISEEWVKDEPGGQPYIIPVNLRDITKHLIQMRDEVRLWTPEWVRGEPSIGVVKAILLLDGGLTAAGKFGTDDCWCEQATGYPIEPHETIYAWSPITSLSKLAFLPAGLHFEALTNQFY
ncbi:hypothetical protein SCT_1411 [Sulfuricella sp. T08]|nr:hypothetical protein SCT_1411 [Sulfuricella sp. T08]